jgi:hypothetical protein
MQAPSAALKARHARPLGRSPIPELVAQRSRILANPVHPVGPLERLGERRGAEAGGDHVLDRRPEVVQDLRRLDPRVAADRHDGGRPDQDDLRVGGHLVDHRDGHHADAVVQDDDVGLLLRDQGGEVRRPLRLADDVEALALEDEAQQSLLCRPPLADGDADPSSHGGPPHAAEAERTPRFALLASALWGFLRRME